MGLEAANGLIKQGMDVTVVHLMDSLMENQLDKPAAALLKSSLEQKGMKFLLQKSTKEIIGEDHVTGVRFADGDEIAADMVVMAAGIRPNIELAQRAALELLVPFDGRLTAVVEVEDEELSLAAGHHLITEFLSAFNLPF